LKRYSKESREQIAQEVNEVGNLPTVSQNHGISVTTPSQLGEKGFPSAIRRIRLKN
jgi:transposase-like protein